MELEKAKKILSNMDIDFSGSAICKECIFEEEKSCFSHDEKDCQMIAIETVLKALENSISKDKIKKDLEICEKVYEKEMKPYQKSYGLDVTYLSKKEKAELINKRNCLIVQIETYKQLLKENK